MQTVTLLVDVQNIYYTTRQAYSRHFDYNRFWQLATEGRQIHKAIAFACDRNDPKQREFQNILRGIGFEVKTKPFLKRSDGSAKCDWDVGIAIDALEHGSESDIVVLASGDGDFDLLVSTLRDKHNNLVEVFGVPRLTASSLMHAASRYVPIDDSLLLKR